MLTSDALQDSPVPEEYLWRLVQCISEALMTLENPDIPVPNPGPRTLKSIVHFDIKPANSE